MGQKRYLATKNIKIRFSRHYLATHFNEMRPGQVKFFQATLITFGGGEQVAANAVRLLFLS